MKIEENHLPANCVSRATHIRLMEIRLKIWKQILHKSEKFKALINVSVHIFWPGLELAARDSWFTTRFWIFMTEFFVIMSFFVTGLKDKNHWNY